MKKVADANKYCGERTRLVTEQIILLGLLHLLMCPDSYHYHILTIFYPLSPVSLCVIQNMMQKNVTVLQINQTPLHQEVNVSLQG